ncbi:MAG: hypothetical protein LBT40_08580 [Deltaproteobacteria bacterium]|nr:hypothetical protein [Deltaproteobacteria bacterium]
MIWRSPGGQAYLERVAGDLAQGRNAVMVVPKPLLAGRLMPALQDVMRRRGLSPLARCRAAPLQSGAWPDLAGIIRGALGREAAAGPGGTPAQDRGRAGGPAGAGDRAGGPNVGRAGDRDGGRAGAGDRAGSPDVSLAGDSYGGRTGSGDRSGGPDKDRAGDRDGGLHALYDSFLTGRDGLRFLGVEGLDALPEELRAATAMDVSRWASVARERPGPAGKPGGLRIALAVAPSFGQVKSDLFLAVHAFWAAVTRNDQDWAFNRLYNEHPSEDPAVYLFLKALCLAICQEDFELMERIVARSPATLRDAYAIVQAHPLRRVAERLPRAREAASARSEPPAFNHGRPPKRPVAPEEAELWSEGLMAAVGSAGAHPSLMRYEELERAVASSQRELFLPLVDYVHSLVVSAVERGHGPGVWAANVREEEERNEILTEISPLAFFIKRRIQPKGDFDHHARECALECAFAWRRIRHSTAHNRMASIELIRSAISNYERLRAVSRGLQVTRIQALPDWLRNPVQVPSPSQAAGAGPGQALGPVPGSVSGSGPVQGTTPGSTAGPGPVQGMEVSERPGPGPVQGTVIGQMPGPWPVQGTETGQRPEHGPGPSFGQGPGAAPGGAAGQKPGPGSWAGSGTGTGPGAEARQRLGAGPGSSAGPSPDAGPGPVADQRPRPGSSGQGLGTGPGTVAGQRHGSGPGSSVGQGPGATAVQRHGSEPGSWAGSGPGAAAGQRHGSEPGSWAGSGPGAGPRTAAVQGHGSGPGTSAGQGQRTGQAPEPRSGSSSGPGPEPGGTSGQRPGPGPVQGATVWLRPRAGPRHEAPAGPKPETGPGGSARPGPEPAEPPAAQPRPPTRRG